jgi:phosphatidylglycerophosphate synthase
VYKAVLAAYRPRFRNELRTEWAAALLYRPISLLVTPLLAACRVPPLAVTLMGAACVVALPLLAFLGWGSTAVGLVGILFCVLDCMDGDLARATGQETAGGAYADFVVDLVHRAALYGAVGFLWDASYAGLAAGLGCACIAFIARACRLYQPPHAEARPPGVVFSFLSGLDHLLPVALIVLGALDALGALIAWLALYSFGDFLVTQRSVLARLR